MYLKSKLLLLEQLQRVHPREMKIALLIFWMNKLQKWFKNSKKKERKKMPKKQRSNLESHLTIQFQAVQVSKTMDFQNDWIWKKKSSLIHTQYAFHLFV